MNALAPGRYETTDGIRARWERYECRVCGGKLITLAYLKENTETGEGWIDIRARCETCKRFRGDVYYMTVATPDKAVLWAQAFGGELDERGRVRLDAPAREVATTISDART